MTWHSTSERAANAPSSFLLVPFAASSSSDMRFLSVAATIACAGLVLAQDAAQAPFAAPLTQEHEAAITASAEKIGYTVSFQLSMRALVELLLLWPCQQSSDWQGQASRELLR